MYVYHSQPRHVFNGLALEGLTSHSLFNVPAEFKGLDQKIPGYGIIVSYADLSEFEFFNEWFNIQFIKVAVLFDAISLGNWREMNCKLNLD